MGDARAILRGRLVAPMQPQRTSALKPLARFLRRYAARYLPVYALGVVALIGTNYINVLIPELIGHAIDAITLNQATSAWIRYVAFIGLLAIAVMLVRTLSRVLFFNPGRTIEFRLKNDYFAHLLRMGPAFFQRWRTGELISRGTNDMQSVRAIIGYGTLQIFNVAMSLGLTLYKMVSIQATLTLLCLLPFSVAVVVLRHGIRLLLKRYRLAQEQIAAVSDAIMDSYSGVAVIQAFNAQDAFAARFDAANQAYLDNAVVMARLRAFYLPVVVVVGNACLFVLLLAGGNLVIDGALTLGAIAALAAYVSIVVASLNSLGWVINAIQRGLVSLGRVQEVLNVPPPLGSGALAGEATASPATIEVRGLTFRYPPGLADAGGHGAAIPRDEDALHDVSFRLGAGHTVGIFGPTGSGKTTLVNLLTRFLLPAPGTVFIDGRDVLEWPARELRDTLTVVPQDPFLFSRSIRENVGFSDLPAEIDEDRVEEALRLACLDTEMAQLAKGLDTVVGERGVTLSGGQRQRTALARAFYRRPRALVLDDVLSAVDHTTEKRLIEHIRLRSAGLSTLIVSHRVSALMHAEEILVLDGGRIIDRGTHAELVSRPGVYADTWRYQQEQDRSGEAGDDGRLAGGEHG